MLPIYKLTISEDDLESGVEFISLVDRPAIEKDFMTFNKMQFLKPTQGETKEEFLPKCIKYVIDEGKDTEQAVAICNSMWDNKEFAEGDKVSFDYDDTLSTARGKELAMKEIASGSTVYIISARDSKDAMLSVANELGIAESRVYATGSNENKVAKIKELGITKHYDNNQDVIDAIGSVGMKFESYNDYPEAAKSNAERGIRLNEELGNKCATQVGKVRAQQIANGEPLSEETIKRTYSYLSRAKEYYNPDDTEACGTISYLLWGGEEMLGWCERKMSTFKKAFAIQNEEKRIISGAAMLADLPIYRRDDMRGEYYVVFDKETIYKIAKKWALNNKYNSVNVDHKTAIEGCTLFETYILDFERGIMPPKGFEDAKDGSWFVSYFVEDDSIWAKCKDGTWNGFSVEGYFDFVEPMSEDDKLLEDLKSLLSKWNGK